MTSMPRDRIGWARAPRSIPTLVSVRTWREFAYLWAVLVVGSFGVAYVVLVPSLTAALAITVVGLVLVGALIVGARGWGWLYRLLALRLLGQELAEPAAWVRPRSFWRSYGAALTDGTGWRALLFMLLVFPLGVTAAVVSTSVLGAGVGAVTHVLWSHLLPPNADSRGVLHYGIEFDEWFIDTPARTLALAAAGIVVLSVWPVVNRLLVLPFRLLGWALLGRTAGDRDRLELRRERDDAVDDSTSRLRRIERDLHDGTQARLVAVAMQLGEAREQIAIGGDPALVGSLLDSAHESTKSTLVELREIALGIHPAALDEGLAVALESLASRSVVPVELTVEPGSGAPGSLTPAVESIAYYTVAELLTNVAKHAEADLIQVVVDTVHDRDSSKLRIRVRDDGRGGARRSDEAGSGKSGLAGLLDRLTVVDGALVVDSPAGGPTEITATVPSRVASR